MSNLLLTKDGTLKIADFGLARKFKGRHEGSMTPKVVTLWYRAPELLLGALDYSAPIDLWSIGCIFGELLHHAPILPGTSEPSQLGLIVDLLGKPNAQIWPTITSLPLYGTIQLPEQKFNNLRSRFASATSKTLELLGSLLRYDPHKRISVSDALQHLYFYEVPSVYDHVWFQNVKRGLAVRLRATPQEQKPVNKDKMSDSVVQKLIAQSTPTGYFYNDPKRAYGMDEMSKWAKRELVVSPPPRNKRIPKKRRNQ